MKKIHLILGQCSAIPAGDEMGLADAFASLPESSLGEQVSLSEKALG